MTNVYGVLVVEDMDIIARLLARCVSQNRWLSLAGVAATEKQAVDVARRLQPDLVLLDFGLSAPMGGFAVWDVLRKLDKMPDVIAVTAAADMKTVDNARRLGAFSYVVKPFTSGTVAAKLADYTCFRRSFPTVPPHPGQDDIDRFFSPRIRSYALPPGLLPETRDRIVAVLRAAERPLRAAEIAQRADVERGTANRYLTFLCEHGVADRVPEHGRQGHPAFLYTLAESWRSFS